MSAFDEGNSLGRWIVSASTAFIAILLFMFLSLKTVMDRPLPDLGPLLELEYVTIEEPRKKPEKPPPQVKPRKVEQTPPEPPMQPAPEYEIPEAPLLEAVPASPVPADIPEPTSPPAPSVEPDAPRRIGSTAELDNVGFEPIFNPKPDYPVVAQEARITGYVDVDLIIDGSGKVKSFSFVTIKGHQAFSVETAKVLPRWRFPPPRINGKKCSVKYVYRINFTLH